MEDFDVINDIWKSKNKIDLPDFEQIKDELKKYNKKRKAVLLFYVSLLLLCFFSMVLIAVFNKNAMWTTSVGEIMILITILITIITFLKQHKKDNSLELLKSNEFINQIKEENLKRIRSKDNTQNITFLLLIISYGLFIYEKCSKDLNTLLVNYSVFAIVILILWFIYKPFYDKREQNKINGFTSKIENLKKQLENEK